MPPTLPPPALSGSPRRFTLPAGTSLWRVHRSGAAPAAFDPPRATPGPGGGRFDSVGPDGYSFMYGSFEKSTALTERFVRDLDFRATGDRYLRRVGLEHQSVSMIATDTELSLLQLVSGSDLAAVHQDEWLSTARPPDYDLTRRWATWLREKVPWAQGFVWQSSIDQPNRTTVLFGDRCDPRLLQAVTSERLDDPARENWLRHLLGQFCVKLWPEQPIAEPRVFINYRSDNCGLAAKLLDRELTRRLGDAAVFLDRRSIAPGAEFQSELMDGARGSTVLLTVIGPGWEDARNPDGTRRLDHEDDWVRREIREAITGGVTVIPVLVGMRERLDETALPDDVRGLVGFQYLHLPDGYTEASVGVLVDRLLERFDGLDR